MSKQAGTSQHEQDEAQVATGPAAELEGQHAGPLEAPGLLPPPAIPSSTRGQVAVIADRRISPAQRQALAREIGGRQGNRHLSGVIARASAQPSGPARANRVPRITQTLPAGAVAREYGPERSEIYQPAEPDSLPVAVVIQVDPEELLLRIRPEEGELPPDLSAVQVEDLLSLRRAALWDEPPMRRRQGNALIFRLDNLNEVDWAVLGQLNLVPREELLPEEVIEPGQPREEVEFTAPTYVGPRRPPPAPAPPRPPEERRYQPVTTPYAGPVEAEVTRSYTEWDPRHFTRRLPQAQARLERNREELRHSQEELSQLQAAPPASLTRQQRRRMRYLQTRIRELPRQISLDEEAVAPQPSPERFGAVQLIQVDLTRSGVQLQTARGASQSPDQWLLDPVFAEAMLSFLRMLASDFNIAAMRNAAFLRNPISPLDTHPLGQACDITGFVTADGEVIALRSGQLVEPDMPDFEARHSDWFDNTHRIRATGQTHEALIRGIARRMPDFFGRIVGPGADELHMDHFHVELTGHAGREGALNAPATRLEPYPYESRR